MTNSVLGCRRRGREQERPSSSSRNRGSHRGIRPGSFPAMAPRSFEHRIYITLARTGHRLAYISRGLIGCFMSHLEGISNFCAIYSFTGILFTAYVGTMIKKQPLFIKGIDSSNQELMKESAFGAMGMFIFLFTSSVLYIFFHKQRDDEHAIMAQGYMRPQHQGGRLRMSDYQVELPHSTSSSSPRNYSGDSDEEFQPLT